MVGIIVVELTNVRNIILEVLEITILLELEVRAITDLRVLGHGIREMILCAVFFKTIFH